MSIISRIVSVPSTALVFIRQRAGFLRWLGFPIIFVAIVAAAWWGLNMRQAPVPKQLLTPDLGSDTRLPLGASATADDAHVPPADLAPLALSEPPESSEPMALPVSEPSESSVSPEVHRDRVSSLLASPSYRARAVYSGKAKGKRRVKVEFLTKGAVSDTYSEDALSRKGWKLSISADRRTALLKKAESAYSIPVVDNSFSSKSKQKSRSNRRVARSSRLTPVGDHAGVGYLKHLRLSGRR
ncbi:MAG: hypothetical protein FWG26_07985 [Betaproteobacteria bacterium]|jgi:hypothetical protein|nr:hypothetical protein [Betaproteobacteria bacterium]